ncbi:MAG: protoheme IX farnesyltransferase [Rickettsiaceae bacterium H1]|nr:protoheme IX farnesyltransferase [Rickettsiaceae bacterium H1]
MTHTNLNVGTELSYHSTVFDYVTLLKPRVLLLVVFTAIAGMLMAPGNIHPFLALVSALCIAIGSGAAGAINMWYDSDIDSIMERTKTRPIPAGKICKDNAFELGIVLSIVSVVTMAWTINYISAFLLLGAILFYSVVYTIFLKRYTHHNIVVGGAAGAMPPIIGWAAVTGEIGLEPIVLFIIILMWTPPHFWALSLLKSEEYKKANVPMLPVTHGDKKTREYILLYTTLLVLCTIIPCFIRMSGVLYNIAAIILGVMFLIYSYEVYLKRVSPYKLFKFSILYLFLLFISMIIDKLYV